VPHFLLSRLFHCRQSTQFHLHSVATPTGFYVCVVSEAALPVTSFLFLSSIAIEDWNKFKFLLLDNTLFNFLIDAFRPPRGHVHTTMKSGKTEKLQVALIKKAKKIYSTVKSSDSKGPLSKFISFPIMSRWITIDSRASSLPGLVTLLTNSKDV
jgi:hypothetical protein